MSEQFTNEMNPNVGKRRRIGVFTIHTDLLENEDIKALLAECVPVKERFSNQAGFMDILVEHPEFDLITEGDRVPQYIAYFTRNPNGTVTRDRIERVS